MAIELLPARPEFMKVAINVAKEAAAAGNYPIGSVVVRGDEVVASAFTSLHTSLDPTAHGEVLAIRGAAKALGTIRLEECELYSTLEPCPMCTTAALWARMSRVVFGASQADAIQHASANPNEKFTWRQIEIPCDYIAARGNPPLAVRGGFMRDECVDLMRLT